MSKIKIVDHSADTQASKKRACGKGAAAVKAAFRFCAEKSGKALQLLIALVIPVALFYLTDSLKYNPFEALNKSAHPYNILIYELIFLFLFFLTGRVRIALPIQILLFFVSGLANYYVMEFRTNPIVPWDIFSIKTAASVAENYSYALPGETILHLSGYLVLLLISLLIPLKFPKKTFWIRLLPAAAVAVIFAGFYHLLGDAEFRARHGIYDKQFTPVSMYKKEGLALNFLMNLHFVFVDVPEGYEKEEMEELLAKVAGEPAGLNYPNIIVIMDEAFSDLTVLGDMPTNTDPIPFVHSMLEGAEDTVSGTLNVSVVGGNTANTEFEFLTGNTMALLPTGSIPYQQYINGEISALPRYLESLGYDTVAMHPYYPTGWERNEVYPRMGFSKMLFKDDFTDTRILRKYVDDASDFENVIRQFENKGEDPLFVFNVTMQNHSSYSEEYDDLPLTVHMDGVKNVSLSTYLTLCNYTDQALEDLIEYFSSYEEDTVIVFFGDHQPAASVVSPVWKHNGKNSASLSEEDQILRYQVPYLIWANFDIEEAQQVETSANYLAAHVLKCAGIPLADYQIILQNIEEEVPVVTAACIKDKFGNVLESEERKDILESYQKLQYYRLFQ